MTNKFEIFLFYITVFSGLGLLTNSVLGIVYFAENRILSNFILSIYILPFAAYGLCTQIDLTIMLNSNKRFAIFYIIAGTLGLGLSFPSLIISLFIIANGLLYIFNEYRQQNIDSDNENKYVKQVNNSNILSPPPLSLSDEMINSSTNAVEHIVTNIVDNSIEKEQINEPINEPINEQEKNYIPPEELITT